MISRELLRTLRAKNRSYCFKSTFQAYGQKQRKRGTTQEKVGEKEGRWSGLEVQRKRGAEGGRELVKKEKTGEREEEEEDVVVVGEISEGEKEEG